VYAVVEVLGNVEAVRVSVTKPERLEEYVVTTESCERAGFAPVKSVPMITFAVSDDSDPMPEIPGQLRLPEAVKLLARNPLGTLSPKNVQATVYVFALAVPTAKQVATANAARTFFIRESSKSISTAYVLRLQMSPQCESTEIHLTKARHNVQHMQNSIPEKYYPAVGPPIYSEPCGRPPKTTGGHP
jgi:hypothetical protein